MKTLIITKNDLDKDNNYYNGKENLSDWSNPFDGHVEIAEGLGYVGFKASLVVSGSIVAKAGSGISAGEGIKAGESISAGEGIKAGESISAGEGISAGWGISAGEGISAGWGIECKRSLSFTKRLFAGTSVYRDKTNEIKYIKCGKLEGGTVCYGDVEETGLSNESEVIPLP